MLPERQEPWALTLTRGSALLNRFWSQEMVQPKDRCPLEEGRPSIRWLAIVDLQLDRLDSCPSPSVDASVTASNKRERTILDAGSLTPSAETTGSHWQPRAMLAIDLPLGSARLHSVACAPRKSVEKTLEGSVVAGARGKCVSGSWWTLGASCDFRGRIMGQTMGVDEGWLLLDGNDFWGRWWFW